MKINGKIKELNQIIISDPSYDTDVNCRYERKDMNCSNWNVQIQIHSVEDKVTDDLTIKGLEFYILLGNPKKCFVLKENGSFSYYERNKISEIDIGIDTACISFGINKHADEIRNSIDIWQPDCSLKTLSDGIFGYVKEGKIDDKTNFIWMSGYITEDADYSIQDIVNYITTQFEVKELYQEINNTMFPVIDDNTNDINYEI